MVAVLYDALSNAVNGRRSGYRKNVCFHLADSFLHGGIRNGKSLPLSALMDSRILSEFVPTYRMLFLSVKETSVSELTKTEHPLGWLLTVLQKERADTEVLSEALRVAMFV